MRTLIFLIAIAVTFASCTKEPDASFTFSPQNPVAGEPVTFTNTSEDGKTYLWDFGDGTTSEEASPSKTFDREGSYLVTLTAYSKKERKEDVTNQYVVVTAPPLKISGSMDGMAFTMQEGMADITSGVSSDKNTYPCGSTSWDVPSFMIYNDFSGETFYLAKGTMYYECASRPENAAFKAFYAPGTYPFSNFANMGFELRYYDVNGMMWSTSNGSQTGSSFTITKSQDETVFGWYNVKIEGTFNCRLYDPLGNEKVLTNGFIRCNFENM